MSGRKFQGREHNWKRVCHTALDASHVADPAFRLPTTSCHWGSRKGAHRSPMSDSVAVGAPTWNSGEAIGWVIQAKGGGLSFHPRAKDLGVWPCLGWGRWVCCGWGFQGPAQPGGAITAWRRGHFHKKETGKKPHAGSRGNGWDNGWREKGGIRKSCRCRGRKGTNSSPRSLSVAVASHGAMGHRLAHGSGFCSNVLRGVETFGFGIP